VIEVGGADVMSTLLILKQEVEEIKGSTMRMIFTGAAEAHLIAAHIGERIFTDFRGVVINRGCTCRESGGWSDTKSCKAVSYHVGGSTHVSVDVW
jgi:hypothetical protein